ncbi:hypothetical protein K523DRAFT_151648 [Schizophyllum commune Tattone D]|nr:hypothetical protein K523DRAFT_151648 [Schizophyllum commune Tattone D]
MSGLRTFLRRRWGGGSLPGRHRTRRRQQLPQLNLASVLGRHPRHHTRFSRAEARSPPDRRLSPSKPQTQVAFINLWDEGCYSRLPRRHPTCCV